MHKATFYGREIDMKWRWVIVILMILGCVGCGSEAEEQLVVGDTLTWSGRVLSSVGGRVTVECGDYVAEFNIPRSGGVYFKTFAKTYTGTIVSIENGLTGLVISLENVKQH